MIPTAMKTNLLLRLAAFVAALATFACTTGDANPGPEAPDNTAPYTLTASIDAGDATRVAADDDGATRIDLKWKADDKIYVRTDNASNYQLYTFTAERISPDGKSATFSCPDFPVGETPAHAIHQGAASISSYYPNQSEATDVNVYNKFVYCRDAASLADHLPLHARNDGTGMTFRPIAAVLKIEATLPDGVSGEPEGFSIAARQDPAAFYEGYYDLTSGTAVRTATGLRHVALFQPAETLSLPADHTVTLYAALCPGEEMAQSLDFDLKVGRHVCSAIVNGAKLEAGKCYPITLPAAKWTAGAIWESGDGSDVDPYLLRSEEHLRSLARAVRTGSTFSRKNFRLAGDITVAPHSEPWLPIGGWIPFYGNIDGGNHTVSGTFRLSDVHGDYLGFFGDVFGQSFSNLTLSGDIIYESERAMSTTLRIGSFAGRSISATFTGCNHTGSLTIASPAHTGTVYAGGIVGEFSEALTGCTQSGGTITVDTPQAEVIAGGIVGKISFSGTGSTYQLHTCHNESALVIRRGSGYAGTLVGQKPSNGYVHNCSSAGTNATITVNGEAVVPAPLIGYGGSTTNCNERH